MGEKMWGIWMEKKFVITASDLIYGMNECLVKNIQQLLMLIKMAQITI